MQRIPSAKEIDRLLIVKTSSIGDVVHALPVVEQIKRANPKMEIGWLVKRRCAGVLEGNPWITRLHVIPDLVTLPGCVATARELRARRYQVALDMQGLFASGLYTWLSGAPLRIGIDRNREGNRLFLTHPIVPGKPRTESGDRHAVDILFGFADILGASGDHTDFEPQPYLAQDGAEIEARIAPLRARGSVVALNVGASSKYKQWPEEHWSALARRLLDAGYGLVFVGDRKDAEIVGAVMAQLPENAAVANLAGKTSLRQLAAALMACDLLVTGDTGPMHMAVAVGTPTVALFGSTNPDRTGPYGARNVVLDMRLDCSPCYRKPTCEGRVDCMRAITPEYAFRTVVEKLGGGSETLARGIVNA